MAHKIESRPDKTDIRDKNDIKLFVDAFYTQVRQDPMLGPVFKLRIPDDASWSPHLSIMCSFWNTVLFAESDYRGTPFPRHVGLSIGAEHFDRWIEYFYQTIDLYFSGPKAEETKDKASKMRMIFESKLKFVEG